MKLDIIAVQLQTRSNICLISTLFHFNDAVISFKMVTETINLDHHLFDKKVKFVLNLSGI